MLCAHKANPVENCEQILPRQVLFLRILRWSLCESAPLWLCETVFPFSVTAQGLPHSFIQQFSNDSVAINTNIAFTDIVKGLTSLFPYCTYNYNFLF